MNLHQLRFVQEAARRKLNLTEAAKALHTSQPGVSKAIIELEDELGVEIFARHGKRLKRVTEPGQRVLNSVEIIMREINNLRRIGQEYSAQDSGTLSIAATHTQARYVLPKPVMAMRKAYPKVNISLHQGSPMQVAQMLLDEVAEIGIATETLSDYEDLITLPCYEWQHMLVVPKEHVLASKPRIALSDLIAYPMVTYHPSYTGRAKIDQVFVNRNLKPNVVLEAIDSDVIQTYVQMGMGIGIVAEMAVEEALADNLVVKPLGNLFGLNLARVAFKRGAYLRQLTFIFAELLSPRLQRELVLKAMSGTSEAYDGI